MLKLIAQKREDKMLIDAIMKNRCTSELFNEEKEYEMLLMASMVKE